MASPGGASSGGGSSLLQNSSASSEEDLQAAAKIDQKRQRRMISNRESARRSRMRKQKHLDDLTSQVQHLKEENGKILASVTVTTEHYFAVEAENSILRTQMMELGSRLRSLNEILHCLNGASGGGSGSAFVNPWSSLYAMSQQPIMASADSLFQY